MFRSDRCIETRPNQMFNRISPSPFFSNTEREQKAEENPSSFVPQDLSFFRRRGVRENDFGSESVGRETEKAEIGEKKTKTSARHTFCLGKTIIFPLVIDQ